jgi:hypothetical protein
MKRRRRLFVPEVLLRMEVMAYGGEIVPPCSLVRAKETIADEFGRESFRIGYYRRQDGLNCVWLVDATGFYERTVDQRFIRDNFDMLELSDETDLYGDDRPVLEPLMSSV